MTQPLKLHVESIHEIWTTEMNKYDESGHDMVCRLHSKFSEIEPKGHNCFGCNLKHEIDMISDMLKSSVGFEYPSHFSTIYIMNLYILTERIFEIKKIIGLPKLYKESVFDVFRIVKLWSNFIKHPKAFILTQHPLYYVEGVTNPDEFNLAEFEIINDAFVKKFYSGEDPNKYQILFDKFKRNPKICVKYPELIKLTKDYCFAVKTFIDIILENKIYIEILNDIGTLQGYFTTIEDD